MSRALVLLIEAQAFLPDGTDAPVIRLVSGGSRADHFGEQWFPALSQLPQMGARLGFNGVSFQAPVTSTTGNFAFSLAMGDLERAADLIWDGADIKIYQGFDGDGDGDFNLIWHGRARSAQATSDAITVTLADPARELDKPLLSTRFQGTGGIEGGEDLKDRLKPKAWGYCENIPAILVDPANLVYRLIDGPSVISLVKDGGVPFNFGTDYPDYASLAAASIPDGQVGICSSLSLVKPWRAPRFALTADITAFGSMRIGDIAQNLIAGASGVTFAPGTLDAFNALQPSHASSYVNDERSIAQELDRLFGGVGSWWMPNAQGEIRLGQVGFGPVVLNVTGSVEDITRNRALPPTHQRVLGYRPNYNPLSEGDIAGAVQAGDIDDLGALATQSTINWDNQVVGRPLSFRVVSSGYSSTTHPRTSGLWDDADTLLSAGSRSYRVNVMDRATRNWISHTHYDVYGSTANAQAMADALNALGSDKIVAIFTHDDPKANRLSGNLPAAMKRCGASRAIFESGNFKFRAAYILIGIPGIGEGNGVELYAGDIDSDPDAWIDTSFTVDALGNLQLTGTNVRDALDISYSDGTVLEDVQPAEAGANVTGTNVAAGFTDQGPLATAHTIPQQIADDSNLLQFTGGGMFTGDLNAEANLAASNALNKGWMTDDLKHWYGDQGNSAPVSSQYTIVDTPDGIVSDTAIRGVDNSNGSKNLFSEFIPIDPARNYQATLWVRQPSGDRRNYILIAFSRADKSHIAGNESNATGWSFKSAYHYQFIANNPFPATWTKYQFTFGPQGGASIPNAPGDEAIFAQLGILGLRPGTTETTIEIQGFRLDEIADATQLINGPAEAGATVGADATEKLWLRYLRRRIPPGMHQGGYGDVRFTKNQLHNGTVNAGEIRVQGTCYYHPDGTKRAISDTRRLNTNFEGSGLEGTFYILYTDENVETRFPGYISDAAPAEHTPNFMCATYDWRDDQWSVFDNQNNKFDFTPQDSDAVVAVGYRGDNDPNGITWLGSLTGVNTNMPEDGAQVNAPNTLALVVNEKITGISNPGEGYFCGVSQGQADTAKDGFILWNGSRITIPRDTGGDQEGFITNASYRRGFIAYDTALTKPFTVHAKARDMAFVFKIGNQWYYDNNSTHIAFTPTSTMLALAWLQTGAADTVIGSGLISPVNLETAALPGADVTEESPWARVGAQPSIVPNGDFEQDLAGWQVVEGVDTDPANTKVIDDAIEGKVLNMPNSGGNRAIGSLTFRVLPGQTYRAIIRARHLGANPLEVGAYFRLFMRAQYAPVITISNRSQIENFIHGNDSVLKNSWDNFEFDYTVPAGMNYASIVFNNWSQSNVDFQIERMELIPLGGASEWGANVTGTNVAAGFLGQGVLATKDFTEIHRWTGSQSVPAQTNYAGGYKINFESDTDGPCRILIKIHDAEGGVHVGLNNVDLGTLSGPDLATLWFERGTANLVNGTNELSIWSTSSDGATFYVVEVHRDPYQQSIASAAGSANWSQVSSRPAELTDGRIAAGLDGSGNIRRALSTSIANSSHLLRRTGGGLFAGELDADRTGVHTAAGFSGQGALATLSSIDFNSSLLTGDKPLKETAKSLNISAGEGTQWIRACRFLGSNGRGSVTQTIYAVGGGATPGTLQLDIAFDWGGKASVRILHKSASLTWIHRIRAGYDIASAQSYVDIMIPNLGGNATISSRSRVFWGSGYDQLTGKNVSVLGVINRDEDVLTMESGFMSNDNSHFSSKLGEFYINQIKFSDENARLINSKRATQSLVGGESTAITSAHLSTTDTGSNITINVSEHTRQYDFGALTYNAGTIGGRSYSTRYYVYADDGAYSGGNVTYLTSTSNANVVGVNRIYLGTLFTPAPQSSGGGGGTEPIIDPFEECLAAHMLLSNGKYARDLEVGDMLDVMDDDMNHVGDRPILALRHSSQNCVELVTKSARVVVSTTAPVVTKERGTLTAPEVKGLTVAVRIKGQFGFEQVLDVIPVGEKPIVRLNVGGISFSAGQEADRLIYTHNILFKQ